MATRVPTMSPEITPQATPQVATPEMVRPAEGAFGGAVAEAGQREGAAVQNMGDQIFQRMMEHKDREQTQQNLDIMTQAHTSVQGLLNNPELDDNQTPKGFLNRTLNQAKGATSAYDQQAIQLKQQIMQGNLSPQQRQSLNESLSSTLLAGREAVVSHEAQQTQQAFDNSFQSAMKSTVSSAANVDDPKLLGRMVDDATKPGSTIDKGWDHAGVAENMKPAMKAGFTDDMIKSALIPLNEDDPDKAQKLFDGVKERLTPQAAAELQNQITGKKTDQTVLQVFDWADQNARRGPDNTIDRAVVDAHVKSLGLPPNMELTVTTHVDRRAMVDASEQAKNKQEVEKNFVNQLTTGVSTGKMQYPDAVKLAVSTGGSPSEIAAREAKVTEAFTQKNVAFPMWLEKQGDDVRGAVESSRQQIDGAYPSTSQKLMKEGATTEMERQWLGKSAAQIRQITTDNLKNVVTKERHWLPNAKETAWKVSAEERPKFDAARDRVMQDGQPPTYDNVKAAMEYLASQDKK